MGTARSLTASALAAWLTLTACGASGDGSAREVEPAASASAPVVTLIVSAATTDEPAERVDDPIDLAWIGGSEVELRDVSLPGALADALPDVAGRPLNVRGYTRIAPMPPDIGAAVAAAVADGADALLISINIAWLTWEFPNCNPPDGVAVDPVERYVCVLTPISDQVTAGNRAAIQAFVDTVVATGLPAYLYLLPHSQTALGDPRLATLLVEREAELDGFDPGVATVEFHAQSFTRFEDGFDQPDQFADMVHPTAAGATAIAGHLAGELERFLGAQLLD